MRTNICNKITSKCTPLLRFFKMNNFGRDSATKTLQQARRDLNSYLAVLETAVLPVELPTYVRFIWAVRRHLRLTQ